MAKSSFYYYVKGLSKADKHADTKRLIRKIYHQHKGKYGYRRVTLELQNQGYLINHKTVFKLMRSLNLKSVIRVKKYKSYRGEEGRIAPNLLNREFKAEQPNQKWATDVTEFKVAGKKLYLSPIIDLYNQEIISYELAENPNAKSVMDMVKKAVKKANDTKSILLHSDQGWQYQMKQYQHYLKEKNITQSMSRRGNCLDNAVIENFFGILKSELFYLKKYSSINQLKTEIKEYINYYNKDRIKLNLKGMSPVKYRAHHLKLNR